MMETFVTFLSFLYLLGIIYVFLWSTRKSRFALKLEMEKLEWIKCCAILGHDFMKIERDGSICHFSNRNSDKIHTLTREERDATIVEFNKKMNLLLKNQQRKMDVDTAN